MVDYVWHKLFIWNLECEDNYWVLLRNKILNGNNKNNQVNTAQNMLFGILFKYLEYYVKYGEIWARWAIPIARTRMEHSLIR